MPSLAVGDWIRAPRICGAVAAYCQIAVGLQQLRPRFRSTSPHGREHFLSRLDVGLMGRCRFFGAEASKPNSVVQRPLQGRGFGLSRGTFVRDRALHSPALSANPTRVLWGGESLNGYSGCNAAVSP